ncbi:MAG: hypothetical protein ABI405_08340 [Parafilimonas sp.]
MFRTLAEAVKLLFFLTQDLSLGLLYADEKLALAKVYFKTTSNTFS